MVGVNLRSVPTRAVNATNATNKSKRGGRRVNRNESFEDLFTGNSFGDEHATSRRSGSAVSDEASLNSGQLNFTAPFARDRADTVKRNNFVGESDEEMSMSGDEDLFVSEKRGGRRRRGSKKAQSSHSDESEYDAASVDFNDESFGDNFQSDDEGANQDLEASFSWKKPVSVFPEDGGKDNIREMQNAFNASFSKKIERKEKKHIPLSTILTTSSSMGTPVSSIASCSVTGQKTKSCAEKASSTRSPTAVTDEEAFEIPTGTSHSSSDDSFFEKRAKVSEAPPAPIDTNTPEGLAATYVMAPSTRARSRSRAASRTRTRARSRSCARERKEDNAEFPSMFPRDDDEVKGELDLFADNQPPKESITTDTSEKLERSSRTSSRDSGKSSRGRSKSRSRTSSSINEGEQTASPTRSSRSSGKVTRIRIKTKGNQKIDPATAKRLISERMKQLKESGDHSDSSALVDSINDLFQVENNGGSATSLSFHGSCGDLEGAINDEKKKDKKHKKKSKEGDDKDKKRKSKKKTKTSADLEGSFTESSLDASARFNESFSMSSNFTDNYSSSKKKLSLVEESPLEGESEKEGRSKSRAKSSSRGRSESPTKRSKSGESKENEKKERTGRSKSPTKRRKEKDEKASRERHRSASPSKRSKEDRGRSKSEAPTGERSRSKAPSEKSKEHRARSKSRVRSEDRARSKSRARKT